MINLTCPAHPRRRLAALAALTTAAALVAAGLSTPPASAAVGDVTGASPVAVSNTTTTTGDGCDDAEQVVRFSHETPYPESGEPGAAGEPGQGTQVELVRTDTDGTESEDVVTGNVVENPADTDPFKTSACFRFGPGSAGTSAPANPGRYNVYVFVTDRRAGDMCTGCFSVISAAPTVTKVTPPELPTGVQGQIFAVIGTNYAKSTVVEALLPGTDVVDPTVTFTAATQPLVAGQIPLPISNTATKLSRTIRVDPAAPPGFRDIRVRNTDRQAAVAPEALRITGLLVQRVDPSAAGNTAVQRATLTGRGFVPGSVPSLVDESSAANTAVVGTDVVRTSDSALSADFDLRGVRPGHYRVRVQNPDGSSTTPECSPVFTVVDTAGGTGGGAQTRSSEFGCRTASGTAGPAPSGSPAPPASPSASPSATASASPSASASASASPSATPTATISPSGSPSAQADARYAGLSSPVRVLDTRRGGGSPRRGEIVLDLSGELTDPGTTAAVLNVTVTNASARGFLVAYPHGTPRPGTSNVNVNPGQTQANEVVVGLSSSKRVSLWVDSTSAHVIVDLVGGFTRSSSASGGRVATSVPMRVLDTRTTGSPRRSGEVVLDLRDRLPQGTTDAILNVTVTVPSARGFVTVFPTGTPRPGTSNVNVERGQTQANEVITGVGTGANAGRVSLHVDSTEAALVVDLVGAVLSGSPSGSQGFGVLDRPVRAYDSRQGSGAPLGGDVVVTMPAAVPADATGVILNVTATNGTGPGFVAVFPTGTSNPGTSNVNFPGERRATASQPASAGTQANEVVSRLGSGRRVTLHVGGGGGPAAHVIVDVVGYLRP